MATIIDVSTRCGNYAGLFAAAGVQTVIRYYSRDTLHDSKRLHADEAHQFAAVGLRLGIVHESRRGDLAARFSQQSGQLEGAYARDYGARIIGQPAGSAIYFAVDFDASATELRDRILPYFAGVAETMAAAGGPAYAIGVYGSGRTCAAVLNSGHTQHAWLAQSTGWAGFTAFSQSGNRHLKQAMPIKVAGIDCDPNIANPQHLNFGDFTLPTVTASMAAAGASRSLRVIARSGLRLRAGAGLAFDTLRMLAYGTPVHPLKISGDWTQVDLEGDGRADGFVSTAYPDHSTCSGSSFCA